MNPPMRLVYFPKRLFILFPIERPVKVKRELTTEKKMMGIMIGSFLDDIAIPTLKLSKLTVKANNKILIILDRFNKLSFSFLLVIISNPNIKKTKKEMIPVLGIILTIKRLLIKYPSRGMKK